jgi:hypothetical protein
MYIGCKENIPYIQSSLSVSSYVVLSFQGLVNLILTVMIRRKSNQSCWNDHQKFQIGDSLYQLPRPIFYLGKTCLLYERNAWPCRLSRNNSWPMSTYPIDDFKDHQATFFFFTSMWYFWHFFKSEIINSCVWRTHFISKNHLTIGLFYGNSH